jgi:hypothetical protein
MMNEPHGKVDRLKHASYKLVHGYLSESQISADYTDYADSFFACLLFQIMPVFFEYQPYWFPYWIQEGKGLAATAINLQKSA